MRRTLVAVVAGLVLANSFASADDKTAEEVLKALRALNEAFAKPDADTIRALMTEDHQAITPYYGVATKEEQIRTLPELKLSEYQTGKETVKLLSPDVAVISYPLTMKGTFKGKPVARDNFAVAVWIKRQGKWRELSYQETALPGK